MSDLNHQILTNVCRELKIVQQVHFFQSVSSTNDLAWQLADNPAHHGTCVLAEHQTAGRGQRGNRWQDSAGQSILCSIVLFDPPVSAQALTLMAAVAIAEGIEQYCRIPAEIKWPNDLFCVGKKVGGILVEKKTVGPHRTMVLGFGINCHQNADFFVQQGLADAACSLAMATGGAVNRTDLLVTVLRHLDKWLARAQRGGDFMENLIANWQARCRLLGQIVTVVCNGRRWTGSCVGVDPTNALLLQLSGGAMVVCPSATTRIQAIHKGD